MLAFYLRHISDVIDAFPRGLLEAFAGELYETFRPLFIRNRFVMLRGEAALLSMVTTCAILLFVAEYLTASTQGY